MTTNGRQKVMWAINSDQKPRAMPRVKNSAKREMAITISGDIITTNSRRVRACLPRKRERYRPTAVRAAILGASVVATAAAHSDWMAASISMVLFARLSYHFNDQPVHWWV